MIFHFMENYTFVFQDVVKSLNWNNAEATIHPLVIHFKKYDKLKHKSSSVYLITCSMMCFLFMHVKLP